MISSTPKDAQAIVGQECHIISGKTEGPRHDPTYPPDKIDEVGNLVLLCAVHHKMVDDQSETYNIEILRKLKTNHEAWVRTALTEQKWPPAVKIRRVKENIPQHMVRINTGREVIGIVDGSLAFQFDHPEPKTPQETQLLAHFLQEAQDLGDLLSDFEAGDRVQVAFHFSELIAELEGAGFWVFGGREKRRLEGGIGAPSDWPVAILDIRRSTDPEIIKTDPKTAKS